MRYLNLPNVVFVNAAGYSITVKDFYGIPTDYIKAMTVKLKEGDLIDEIANRKDVYGSGSENSIYKILEFNKTAIMESNFDLNKLKSLDIPIP